MHRLSRHLWIQAGFDTLDSSGFQALSVERIARRLDVTRGSFYHHFLHRTDYVDALLQCWQAQYTDDVIAHALDGHGAQARLQRYLEVASQLKPGREVAIRAWAARDARVRLVLEQVDGRRMRFVQIVGRDLLPRASEETVQRFARVACFAFIGFQTACQGREQLAGLAQDVLALAGVPCAHTLADTPPVESAPAFFRPTQAA